MWKWKAGRQEKKKILFVCLFAEAWAVGFVFRLSSNAFGLHAQHNGLSPQYFIVLSYANKLIFPYAFWIPVGSPGAYVVKCVLIFFQGVLHAHRVGMMPPLELQHYITHPSEHMLWAGKKVFFGKMHDAFSTSTSSCVCCAYHWDLLLPSIRQD